MMTRPTQLPDGSPPLPALLYRSEAFAEDLEGLLPAASAHASGDRRTGRSGWLLVLPLAVLLIGSVSALAWV